MARARTANGRYAKGVRAREAKLLDQYISLVSRLPFVEEVRDEPGYTGVQVWTVIDSEPWADGPNDQVYSAELQAYHQCPNALVDFRLINRREYGDEAMEWAVPKNAHVAWRRSSQS